MICDLELMTYLLSEYYQYFNCYFLPYGHYAKNLKLYKSSYMYINHDYNSKEKVKIYNGQNNFKSIKKKNTI